MGPKQKKLCWRERDAGQLRTAAGQQAEKAHGQGERIFGPGKKQEKQDSDFFCPADRSRTTLTISSRPSDSSRRAPPWRSPARPERRSEYDGNFAVVLADAAVLKTGFEDVKPVVSIPLFDCGSPSTFTVSLFLADCFVCVSSSDGLSAAEAFLMLSRSLIFLLLVTPDRAAQLPEHYQVADRILSSYNRGYIPKKLKNESIKVSFSMELYQIIQVNEPQQYIMLNAWIVERWVDNLLGWDPAEFSNLTEIMIPFDKIWIPDTTLYNSLVMEDEDTRRLLHAKLTTRGAQKGALVELLYPTIYKLSCLLDLRFFPFDLQECKLTFGSWTFDNTLIDYFAHNETHAIGTANCIENEGWNVLSTSVSRHVNKYDCCPNNYTLLEFHLFVQRKPLYWVINLVAPTSIITLISIVGFFSSSSINELRQEKITLGITTLLSMSILIFMVSDKMPSTSSFIPLIGWFYTSMIVLISLSTLAASMVIYIQKQGILGKPPARWKMAWARTVARIVRMEMPLLMKQAYAQKAREDKIRKAHVGRKKSLWERVYKAAKDQAVQRKSSALSAKTNGVNGDATKLEVPSQEKKKFTINTDVTCISDPGDLLDMGSDEEAVSFIDVDYMAPPLPPSGVTKFTVGLEQTESTENQGLHKISTSGSFDSVLRTDLLSPRTAQRNLAELEFDWLAAVMERIFLIVFIIIFLLTSVGINMIGFFYWCTAQDFRRKV